MEEGGGGRVSVVVVPTEFTRRRGMVPLLAANVRKVLGARGQRFRSVKRDGPLIVVDAEDPVFASSAAGLLFGARMVAIARRAGSGFEEAAGGIAAAAGSALLRGDRFHVKVEGESRGFVPGDLETAATSLIIERHGGLGARPAAEADSNRLLRAFLTRSSSYACIFADEGLGGLPAGAQRRTVLCCVFDELSAVSCLETVRQGFDVRIAAAYGSERDLADVARMLAAIAPRTARAGEEGGGVEAEFFRTGPASRAASSYPSRLRAACAISAAVARRDGIGHVALPLTPLIHPPEEIDAAVAEVAEAGARAHVPLGALEGEIFRAAGEIGLGKFLPRIEALAGADFSGPRRAEAPGGSVRATVGGGPNAVHDLLDGVLGGGRRRGRGSKERRT